MFIKRLIKVNSVSSRDGFKMSYLKSNTIVIIIIIILILFLLFCQCIELDTDLILLAKRSVPGSSIHQYNRGFLLSLEKTYLEILMPHHHSQNKF